MPWDSFPKFTPSEMRTLTEARYGFMQPKASEGLTRVRACVSSVLSFFHPCSASKRTILRAAGVLVGLALLAAAGSAAPPAAAYYHCSSQASPALVRDCERMIGTLKDNLDPSDVLTSWRAHVPLSSWRGVTADKGQGVTHLKLSGVGLTGGVARQLAELPGLVSIDLSNNSLSGSIGAEFGNLTNLREFLLNNNRLRGEISAALGRLTQLGSLNLSNNYLSGPIPVDLGNLVNLQTLGLADNRLSGPIPVELGKLAHLRELSLHTNDFTGNVPVELGRLTQLRGMYLFGNHLSGPMPAEIGNLANLEELFLDQNHLQGTIPATFGNLAKLRWLGLSCNRFTGPIPSGLGDISTLTLMELAGNRLAVRDDEVPGNLEREGRTVVLTGDCRGSPRPPLGPDVELSGCASQNSPALVRDCETLMGLKGELDPHGVLNWTGGLPLPLWDGITSDSELGVTELSFSNARLGGTLPADLSRLTNLTELALSYDELFGRIPNELGNLANLQGLWLSGNELSGSIPAELGNLRSLQSLSLGNNQITGSIPGELGRLTNLEVLGLGENYLTGSIPPELGDLKQLWGLWLIENQLSGSIPAELGHARKLRVLYLQENQLSGPIPASFGNLAVLRRLYLYSNQLSGPIPATLGNLMKLEELLVSCNQLTDPVPSQLGDIPTLRRVAFNDNLLELGYDLIPPAMRRPDSMVVGLTYCEVYPLWPDESKPLLESGFTVPEGPVPVGASIRYTLEIVNRNGTPLTGVRWRVPLERGGAYEPLGDGRVEAYAAATDTRSFEVAAHHLPGPIIISVYWDSDETDEWLVGSVAIELLAPKPAVPVPLPAPSALSLRVDRVRFTAPQSHLAHNTPDLTLTLADGTEISCGFLTFYDATGGLSRWGYAISEVLEERPGTLTQYYQGGVFDCSERDGVWSVERRLAWDYMGGGLGGAPDLGAEPSLLSEQPGELVGPWGHRVSNYAVDGTPTGFLDVFERLGGVASFGYPKTGARYDDDFQATLGVPGATPWFIRQYFQAAVLEYRPDDEQAVIVRHLGAELRHRRYPNRSHTAFASFNSADRLTEGQVYTAERVIFP